MFSGSATSIGSDSLVARTMPLETVRRSVPPVSTPPPHPPPSPLIHMSRPVGPLTMAQRTLRFSRLLKYQPCSTDVIIILVSYTFHAFFIEIGDAFHWRRLYFHNIACYCQYDLRFNNFTCSHYVRNTNNFFCGELEIISQGRVRFIRCWTQLLQITLHHKLLRLST